MAQGFGARGFGGGDGASLGHHGGNLDAARRLFPNAPEPWIDLSTGINPFPYPVGGLATEAWTRLPEPAAVAELERAAARAYGARSAANVVAAPGTQSLIQWLPLLLPGRRVGVLGPTYGEYALAWRAAGAEVTIVDRVEALVEFDAGVVCNPNNPDGRMVPLRKLEGVASSRTTLVVDEAFMDLTPEASLVPSLPDNAIVLRSFGKIYGLAGVRLGFAVAPTEIANRLRAALGPWSVSGPAVAIGRRALADAAWLAAMADRLRASARRLDALLTASGATIVGGTGLFRLMSRPDAAALFERLGRAAILVRRFDLAPTRLRIGIPAYEQAWERLETALNL